LVPNFSLRRCSYLSRKPKLSTRESRRQVSDLRPTNVTFPFLFHK
jgi:hypothetical protein